jgi:alpha-tubulin suppressor-like RCC1 family protein
MMKGKSLVLGAAMATAAVLAGPRPARAQPIQPTAPPTHGSVPAGLECTAEALNVSGFVDSSGSIVVYNVPSSQGSVRVRATCVDPSGVTRTAQSPPAFPVPGGITTFGALDFGTAVPIASHLTVSPAAARIVGLGATQQLSVGSTFADLTTGDVTPASTGTTYRSSNPAVATVSAGGLVTAVGPGSALIYALNDGAGGLSTVSVLPASLTSLSVVPGSLSFALSPVFPSLPSRLRVSGLLSDSSVVDWSTASSGVTYLSSDPTVAAVSADGTVVARGPGSAFISITDGPSGLSTGVGVDVSQSAPFASNACAVPGFSYRVDLDGDRAFVAAGLGGLQILNTDDCTPLGALGFPGKSVVDVRLRGSLAALALGVDGLALVDVTTVANPTVLSTTTSIGTVRDVWISGDTLYAASSSGLFVYDVSSPATPVLLGTQVFGSGAQAVAADAARGIAVVLTSAPSLEVVRLSGPAPWASVSVPLPSGTNQASDVTLLGTSAYVANGRAGIHEIDVTNPANPSIRSNTIIDFDALGIAVQRTPQGTFVAAADDRFFNAVPLFDPRLNNTFNINFSTFSGDIQPDANSTGIALGDGFGVVTTGPSGIQVFRSRPLVDNGGVAPTVSILTPSDSATIPAGFMIPVTAVASDDVKVSFVELFIDGQLYDVDYAAPFTFFFPAGTLASTQTIQLQATDLGGNVGISQPVQVTVAAPPPPPPPGPLTLSAGYGHTCHRPLSGGVLCWGYNGVGALGDGTGSGSATPVSALNAWDVVDVSAGGNHTCAQRVSGRVGCWGYNGSGELGIGTVGGAEGATASDVIGLTDAVQLGTGNFYSCARRTPGTVACWGTNSQGMLGNGSGVGSALPVPVTGVTDATDLGAGVLHACVVHASGALSCWGYNGNGGLGDGSTTTRPTPVDVVGITDATQVAGGLTHTCARRATGTVSCWGSNGNGELGNGTTTQSTIPVDVVGITDAVDVRASISGGGGDFTCALHATGVVSCWGYNGQGQLGDGTNTNRATPVDVVGLTGAVKLATGWRHACAQTGTGSVQCWGWNQYGQLGDGTFTSRTTPVVIIP